VSSFDTELCGDVISSKQLSVMHCIILHAVMDFTTELRCLATHTQSVCPPLFGNLYFSLSPFAYLSARAHTHTHTHTCVLYIHIHRDSNYNRTHHSDRLLVFWLSKQILKTLFSKPMLLLKARSSSSDVLRDISSKVQVASNI